MIHRRAAEPRSKHLREEHSGCVTSVVIRRMVNHG